MEGSDGAFIKFPLLRVTAWMWLDIMEERGIAKNTYVNWIDMSPFFLSLWVQSRSNTTKTFWGRWWGGGRVVCLREGSGHHQNDFNERSCEIHAAVEVWRRLSHRQLRMKSSDPMSSEVSRTEQIKIGRLAFISFSVSPKHKLSQIQRCRNFFFFPLPL